MNVKRDPDAILDAWLDEGPHRLPEPTRRAIAVSTRNIRQSRRPRWVPWRFPNMNGMSRTALAAVAVVAVLLGGLYLFSRAPAGGVGGPSASSSPSPASTPWPFPTDTSGGVEVAPGTYALDLPAANATTGASQPLRITMTVPAGWAKNLTPTTLWRTTDNRRFGFFTADNLVVDPCAVAGGGGLLDPPLGPSVDDLVAGLHALPDLTSTTPTTGTLSGFTGKQLEISAPDALPSCAGEYRQLWTDAQAAVIKEGMHAIAAHETARVLALDVNGVRLVVSTVADRDASAADLAELQAILDSIHIERRPTPSGVPSPSPS
jgi:hypothetical protein